MNLESFFKLTYGLYIVSSAFEENRSGCVVNTLSQVTAEPIQLTVAIHKDNFTAQLIQKSQRFNGVALTQGVPMEQIRRFGFQSGRDVDKFAGIPLAFDAAGIPYPTQSVAAMFSCKVVDQLDLGSHLLFVGLAEQGELLSNEPVLTYTDYHMVKKEQTPPKASSYQAPKKQGWRCKICGYVYEGDTLPEGFICPVCKKDASFFEKL